MLTVEHTKLRRKKGVVEVVPLCGLARNRAVELAEIAVEVTKAHEGEPRAALEDALDELPLAHDEVKFGRGLKKLALDACAFLVETKIDPEELRANVFLEAARMRRAGSFDRALVLSTVAARMAVASDDVERGLYADLSAAHAVRDFTISGGEELVERYAVAEMQAVLLRATRLVIDVEGGSLELRALLRAVKFHQLLFDVEQRDDGVRLVVEGPMGLFQQSTRYGLKLAMLLPHVLACARYRVEATVRLRKGGGDEKLVMSGVRSADIAAAALPDAARTLLDDLVAAGGPWRAALATEVLRLEGEGALVPDLRLENEKTGEVVYVEVLGFWSRAAVWKRVELVEKGLPYRIVFCASERLRVSEQALADDAPGALVVFKGVLRATRVLEAVDAITRARRDLR